MSQTLAAVGAVLMAVLQSTIVPFLVVDGATPDLLLVDVDGDVARPALGEQRFGGVQGLHGGARWRRGIRE